MEEYKASVNILRDSGVNVLSLEEKNRKPIPDAVFCNNWISTTKDGTIVVYPMLNQIRKDETLQLPMVQKLLNNHVIKTITQLGRDSEDKDILEGTGSMVIDHSQKVIFAAKSPRTQLSQLTNLTESVKYYSNFEIIMFDAKGTSGTPIYHTNIIMSVGKNFAILCSECTQSSTKITSKIKRKRDY